MEASMAERTISATEARVHFGEVMDSVAKNEDVVFVARAGKPQVVIVSVEEWRRHQRQENPWTKAAREMEAYWAYMEEARKAGRVKDEEIDVEEIVRTSREERDEQLLRNVLGQ
jgi:prevent-host-death family protein